MTPPDDEGPLRYVSWIERQAGVFAWIPGARPVRFVIVTSRRTGRWVFPKGGIDPGMTAPMAAGQEALEEAGVIGMPDDRPIGSYMIPKIRPPLIWAVEVVLYPMAIDEILDVWVEADQRTRRFVTLEEARELMEEPAMVGLAERFLSGIDATPMDRAPAMD